MPNQVNVKPPTTLPSNMQKIVADLHFHSKFSRATSKEMVLENLWKWAGYKGVNLLGTADFTHPFWFSQLKNNLEDLGTGLYKLKGKSDKIKFILSTEISSIYSDGGKMRRIHTVVLMPSLDSVKKFNDRLSAIGNLYSDGRPILGLPVYDLLRIALEVDNRAIVIPAHIWTPWFAVFGSKSGYDSLREAFKDLTPRILAVETGLSADPPMCWRVSELDDVALVSNGDAHSLGNIMREANVFFLPKNEVLTYNLLGKMLKEGSPKAREKGVDKSQAHLAYTIEFYPEEGKYHWSGHRNCHYKTDHHEEGKGVKNSKGIYLCPVCKKPLTLGVMYRVNQLADRPIGGKPKNPVPYKSLVQLSQIIAESFGVGENTQVVKMEYQKLVQEFESEINVLEEASLSSLEKKTTEKIIEGIERVRTGRIVIDPGYESEYGKVQVFDKTEKKALSQNYF